MNRSQQDPDDPPDPPGQNGQKAPRRAAQDGKIGRGPQAQPEDHIQPDLPAAEAHAAEKERQAGQQPEQQVQPLGQAPEGTGQAQLAQHVIQQAHAHPQQQAHGQREQLAGQGDAHPRKSRPKRLWCGSSSS